MYTTPYSINYNERKELANPNTDTLFVERWSPRSFVKTDISQETRETLFDAARWTQSAYNEQPWRVFASSNDAEFEKFHSLLAEPNQTWAKNASILGFIIAKNNFSHNDKPNPAAIYDCGAFWAALTFQARMLGLFTHGMLGIKFDEIYQEFKIPKEKYTLIAGFAIGAIDTPDKLPEQLQGMEAPSPRKAISEFYFPGGTTLE